MISKILDVMTVILSLILAAVMPADDHLSENLVWSP